MKKLILAISLFPLVAHASSNIGHQDLNIRGSLPSSTNVQWGFHLGDLKTASVKNFGDFHDDEGATNLDQLYEISFSSGFDMGFHIDYQSSAWRYEARLSYFNSNHKKIKIDDVQQEGGNKTMAYTGFFNVYYDYLDLNNYVASPFIGAGFGFASINSSISSQIVTEKGQMKAAYNIMAGVSLAASDDLTFDVSLKNVVTAKSKNALIGKAYKVRALEIGFRYNF